MYLIKNSDNGLVSNRNLCKVVRLPYFPGHVGNTKRFTFVRPKLTRHVLSKNISYIIYFAKK